MKRFVLKAILAFACLVVCAQEEDGVSRARKTAAEMPKAAMGAEGFVEVVAADAGYVQSIDANGIAQAAFELGAGRGKSSDAIDNLAGVDLCVKRGDRVEAGAVLARVSTTTRPEQLEPAAARVRAAVVIGAAQPSPRELILEEIA